jgi:orotate phosphoribosyltransferase-like protein
LYEKRVEYLIEIKWKAVKMKKNGYTNREIMEELRIKVKSKHE